jgi:hypothetical protein
LNIAADLPELDDQRRARITHRRSECGETREERKSGPRYTKRVLVFHGQRQVGLEMRAKVLNELADYAKIGRLPYIPFAG